MASLAWQQADSLVAAAFARYNNTVSGEKFGDLYGRAYNPSTGKYDGEYMLLEYPVRWGRCVYYVTEEFPAVYKIDARTGQYREYKTAYKAIKAAEKAIDRAISLREFVEAVEEKYPHKTYSFESLKHAWNCQRYAESHMFSYVR